MLNTNISLAYHTSFSNEFELDPHFIKQFDISHFLTELKFEELRTSQFPEKPSRINGIFAYRTLEEARTECTHIYEVRLTEKPNSHYADSFIWENANVSMMLFLKSYEGKIERRTIANQNDIDIQDLLKEINAKNSFRETIDNYAKEYWSSQIETDQVELLINPKSIESLSYLEPPSKKRGLFYK